MTNHRRLRNSLAMTLVIYALAVGAAAHASGIYAPIPWRANDPFVFCTQGPPPDHQWRPVNPATGAWVPTGKYPNMASVWYYMAICPLGRGHQGLWKGPGLPEMSPFPH